MKKLIAVLVFALGLAAQSNNARLSGVIEDQSGGAIPAAQITLINTDTSLRRNTRSSEAGLFALPNLPPGKYSFRAEKDGFTPFEIPNLVLHANDQRDLLIKLKVASVDVQIEVREDLQGVNISPAVGTVVNRQFVENIPLNGRSFQSLLELTPGVVLANIGHYYNEGGQFSVNGQRTNANYFTVDGVSANAGISVGKSSFAGQSASGSLPALTALGGTNALVSVDALQEFRIQTSSYAPEFGRTPGGQVSMVTRSGTNQFHGALFDYVRNDVMDANDWIANSRGLRKPGLRQNDFGGVFGGPVFRNRTFFFGSYEGLRLLQPRAFVMGVPTVEVRRTAVPALQPYVNAFPIPTGRDLGGGYAEWAASFSDPSRFDATSIRVDHNAGNKLTFFGRFSRTPSYSRSRLLALSTTDTTYQTNTSVTAGSTWIVSNRLVHTVRVNYTSNDARLFSEPDDFGGAVPPPISVFDQGLNPDNAAFVFGLEYTGSGAWYWGTWAANKQRQINIVDSVVLASKSHEWNFGFDFRRINPILTNTNLQFISFNTAGFSLGRAQVYQRQVATASPRAVAFDNLSVYAQDRWKLMSRLALTYGIRWEFVPPPHSTSGQNATVFDNLDNPYGGQVHFAPRNTPLWETRYNNFAPRVGASYLLSEKSGAQLVVRGGFGVFHDLGYGQAANAFQAYPFFLMKTVYNPTFPLTPEVLALPILGVDPPSMFYQMDRHIVLPRTYQWNVSVERSLGQHQALTVSYIGAEGRKLLKPNTYSINLLEWPAPAPRTSFIVNRNRGYSDYRALQIQFERRLHRGLQALVSYTFGRSRDTSSSDFSGPIVPSEMLPPERDYGYSDYDVRNVFTAAVTYQVPQLAGSSLWRAVARNWGADLMFRARSGFPINPIASALLPPSPMTYSVRPNIVPGQPFWIEDRNVPGGRRLNRQAFTVPAPSTVGDLPRGVIRGFNARQVDLTIRRNLRLREGLALQLRFEAFNVFNTPNFGDPIDFVGRSLSSATFGASLAMLNRNLGGLSPLYQIGGPRSIQIAAKIVF